MLLNGVVLLPVVELVGKEPTEMPPIVAGTTVGTIKGLRLDSINDTVVGLDPLPPPPPPAPSSMQVLPPGVQEVPLGQPLMCVSSSYWWS